MNSKSRPNGYANNDEGIQRNLEERKAKSYHQLLKSGMQHTYNSHGEIYVTCLVE